MSPIDWTPPLTLSPLRLQWLERAQVEVAVLRLDLIDSLISGNKWFKLRNALVAAHSRGAPGVVSLGGAHSNHLHALAAAGQRFGLKTVGLLRGHAQHTPTLADLNAMGMQVHWLGYQGYRARHQPDFWHDWQIRYPHFVCIDEGGLGVSGAMGCGQWVTDIQSLLPALGWPDYQHWWLAVGTGTTLAGLVMAERGQALVHGVLAVPADHGVPKNITTLLKQADCADSGYQLHDGSCGGFAKLTPELVAFMDDTEHYSGLPLEPVYTAKALLALKQKVASGYFAKGTRLIFVHTGGLQGRRALEPQLAAFRPVGRHQ